MEKELELMFALMRIIYVLLDTQGRLREQYEVLEKVPPC